MFLFCLLLSLSHVPFTYALTQCQDHGPDSKRPRRQCAVGPASWPASAPSEGDDAEDGDDGEDDESDGEGCQEGEEEEEEDEDEPDEEVDEKEDLRTWTSRMLDHAAKSQKSSRPKAEGPSENSSSWSLPKPAAEAGDPTKTPKMVPAKSRVALGAARKKMVLIICFGCSAKSTALSGKRSSLL